MSVLVVSVGSLVHVFCMIVSYEVQLMTYEVWRNARPKVSSRIAPSICR